MVIYVSSVDYQLPLLPVLLAAFTQPGPPLSRTLYVTFLGTPVESMNGLKSVFAESEILQLSTDKIASEDPHPQDQRSSSGGGGGGRCRGCGFEAVSAETVAHHLFLDCPQHSVARARLRKRISKVVR